MKAARLSRWWVALFLLAPWATVSCHEEGGGAHAAVQPARRADGVLAFCRFYFGENDVFRPEGYVALLNLTGRDVTLGEPSLYMSRRYYLLDEISAELAQDHNRDVAALRGDSTAPRAFHRWCGTACERLVGCGIVHGSLVLQAGDSVVLRANLPADHNYGKRQPDEVGLNVTYTWRVGNGPVQMRTNTFWFKPPGLDGWRGETY